MNRSGPYPVIPLYRFCQAFPSLSSGTQRENLSDGKDKQQETEKALLMIDPAH
jgi:hypothetical protein